MAARIKLDWQGIKFKANEVNGWRSLNKIIEDEESYGIFSERAVYVFRIRRPFSFNYEEGHSPVAYIGKGQAQRRITAHLKSWVKEIGRTAPGAEIEILFCEPRAPKVRTVCEGVEADLIAMFEERYGEIPLRNRNRPPKSLTRHYSPADLWILHPGKGPGFHWALRPLPSSEFFR